VASTNAFKLVLIEPKSFDECPKLVDALKGRRPIIINLEKIETETAKKIFDFLSGATYALNGSVQKVANNIFIFAPESVDIAANQEERGGFDFGGNKSPWR
jgi:cell division inhibitor SepF